MNPDNTYEKIKTVLQLMQLKNNYKWGYLGERFEKVKSEKIRIESATRTAKYRIPDMLTENELIEIKNVKRQMMTHQIIDFMMYCDKTGRKLIIYTREDTKMSPKLAELAEQGKFEIRYLSKFFTEFFQQRMLELMRPTILRALAGVPPIGNNGLT